MVTQNFRLNKIFSFYSRKKFLSSCWLFFKLKSVIISQAVKRMERYKIRLTRFIILQVGASVMEIRYGGRGEQTPY